MTNDLSQKLNAVRNVERAQPPIFPINEQNDPQVRRKNELYVIFAATSAIAVLTYLAFAVGGSLNESAAKPTARFSPEQLARKSEAKAAAQLVKTAADVCVNTAIESGLDVALLTTGDLHKFMTKIDGDLVGFVTLDVQNPFTGKWRHERVRCTYRQGNAFLG